ncbi:MAG: SpoIIE family protein phosphatase [Bacteroidota bacterium]|nr:SpoIIE family protein phosphatase [Bacteroidota bacterium]MDP3146614.1 SpoIIE family protein phosphatase [Bacteroidota bacterium]MDP3556187.1 SpoIIE family protein phosphatase [Bacteroidota bacterium]
MIFLFSFKTKGQQNKFDSLKKELQTTTIAQKRVPLLIEIAKSIYNSIPDSSIIYCEEAEKLSKKHNLEVQLAFSLHCESRYLLLKGDLKATIDKLTQAIRIFEKNYEKTGLAKSYSLKSVALGRLGKYNEALEYLLKARTIFIEINDVEGIANTLTNIANTYCDLDQPSKGLDALTEYEKLNIQKSGREFYFEVSSGNIYYKLGKFIEAINHYKNCTRIAQEYKMLDSEITGLTLTAECYKKLNNLIAAKSFFNSAIKLAKQNNLIVEEGEALKGIISVYEDEADYKNAFYSLKHSKAINDTIFTLEKIKSISDIESKLTITEKEKIIAEQNLSIEKDKVESASLKNKLAYLFGGLAIVIIAFILLFYNNRKTKKLFTLIEKQKTEVEFQKEIIEIKNKDLMDSIVYARHIQGSMLPSDKTMQDLFNDHFVLYKPKDVIAGDFYWTEVIGNNAILVVGDCTGHGVPGALVSVVACNALSRAIKEFKLNDPALIFDKVNELMQETFSKSDYKVNDGMDGALCVFDFENMKLHIAAAHNPIWITTPTNKSEFWDETWILSQISADKQPIGRFNEKTIPFQSKTISIQKGEMIYFFTDGYADQFGGPKGKKFKNKQFQELIISISKLPLKQQKEQLDATIENWKGELDQVDDILIVGIRI